MDWKIPWTMDLALGCYHQSSPVLLKNESSIKKKEKEKTKAIFASVPICL